MDFSAVRITESEWPTAPGQGSISVQCRKEDLESLDDIRKILNHDETENDVVKEREILSSVGGGCLYPAGIKVSKKEVFVQISPKNWKQIFCKGLNFGSFKYNGAVDNATGTAAVMHMAETFSKRKPKRSVAFIGLTAEESGLLGYA